MKILVLLPASGPPAQLARGVRLALAAASTVETGQPASKLPEQNLFVFAERPVS